MTNRYNKKIKEKYFEDELKERFKNIDDNYDIKVKFDNHDDKFCVELIWDEISIVEYEGSVWNRDTVLQIKYDEYISNTEFLNDAEYKIRDYIYKNYLDKETKKSLIDTTSMIMDKYSHSITIDNEYDEICNYDYDIFIMENFIQCGGDINNDCGLCFNIFDHYVEDINEEDNDGYKTYYYSNKEELIFIITQIMDSYVQKVIDNIEKAKQEDEDNDFFEFERHIPPEEYPDWDGDESIMYEIENYVEEDEDELYCPICGSDDLENYGGNF